MARFIRFVPTEYYGYKALRVEVYGVLLSTGINSIFSVPYHWNPTSVTKRGGEYYDLPYLKCFIKSHSLLIACQRKYSQSEFRNSMCIWFDDIVPTPLIVCCDLIPAKIKNAIPFLVYFKCCLSHVRTKFFLQH